MKKRILFLEQYVKIAGGQRVLLSLVEALKERYRLYVVVPEKGDLTNKLEQLEIEYIEFPIGYYSIGKKSLLDILNYFARVPYLVWRLVSQTKKKKINLVYANGARTFIWGTIACALTKTPLIWHLHSIFAKGITRNLCLFFGKKSIVKKIIAVSQAVGAPFPELDHKIEIIYNAIDSKIYFPAKTKFGPLRKEFNIGQDALIAMVGFIMEWKGVEDLVYAAKIVTKTYPQVKFIVVGGPLYENQGQKYMTYLKRLVDELNLNKNIIFTGFREDIPAIMKEIDIFVLASKEPDPCPTCLLQAMASGVTAIATDFGGAQEIIKEGYDGLLYQANNFQQLANKILFLLKNPQVRERIALNAVQKIRHDFNRLNYLNNIVRIIEDCAKIKESNSDSLYKNGKYLQYNPSWHSEDSLWKVKKIREVIPEKVLNSLSSSINVVDIGCGTGEVLKGVSSYLKNKAFTVTARGYDLAPQAVKIAKENFPEGYFYNQEFLKSEYERQNRYIDLVLLIDILEHISNPAGLLTDLSGISRFVICHLPLEDNIEVKIRGLQKRFRKTVGHIHYYNEKSAGELFRSSDFQIKNMIFTCLDYDADYKIKSLLRRFFAQPLRKIFFKRWPKFTTKFLGNCSMMVLLESQKLKGSK